MSTEIAEDDDHRAARLEHNLSTLREQVSSARTVLIGRDTDESRAVALLLAHSLSTVEHGMRERRPLGLFPLRLRRAAAAIIESLPS